MRDDVFRVVIIVIYALAIIWTVGSHIYRRWITKKILSNDKKEKSHTPNDIEGSHKKSFSNIRRVHVTTDESKKYTHMVSGSFEEIFNMFMSISPDVVQTILKIEKTMVILQGEFEKPEISKQRIDELLSYMLIALNQLEEVSIQLIDRMVDVYYENKPLKGEVKIDSQLIEGYITIVNNLENITINYTYHLQKLLRSFKDKYPEKLSEYTTISEKLAYVLYVIVTCCSSRLDKHINVYDNNEEGETIQ